MDGEKGCFSALRDRLLDILGLLLFLPMAVMVALVVAGTEVELERHLRKCRDTACPTCASFRRAVAALPTGPAAAA